MLAAESHRPLALTSTEDMRGFLTLHLGRTALFVITCTSVLTVFLIFLFVIKEALPFLARFSITEFLTSSAWYPEAVPPKFGALALLAGSGYVTIVSIIFAVPLGILAAVFLSDIVSMRIGSIVKPIIEILAAIPSVAYGFFAVLVLAPWMQNKFGFPTGTNALNASLILAVMALPTIISVSEDSISAMGRELREASYSLGATRMETIFKVIIPAAHSGIIAAIVLGMMRAIGETMVVWMASGNAAQIPHPWWDLSQSVRTLTATIAGDMGETAKGSPHYGALFAAGLLLLIITLCLNIISEYFLVQAKKAGGKH
jgi:phosphate transport system permease protein